MVGRLDVNTSGLLLFTNDGELAHRLMHPSSEVEREYRVRVRGRPGPEILRRLRPACAWRTDRRASTQSCPRKTSPEAGSHAWFRVTLHEGRNREVRRLFEEVGFEVSRLLRIRYGPVELPADMRPGQARFADARLMEQLARLLPGEAPAAPAREGPPAAPRPASRGALSRRRPSKLRARDALTPREVEIRIRGSFSRRGTQAANGSRL